MKIKLITTQKVLSPTQISLADFVINPYRGCEVSCAYCYSQNNKNVKARDFGNNLTVKVNASEVLEKELRFKKPKRILLGSTTECFQNKEKDYKITKGILSILNNHNIPYTILTKSHHITDYLELIKSNSENKVYFTFNFSSDKIIRAFEKNSSSLAQRIDAINMILAEGINLRVHIGPFIPFISNLKEILMLLPAATKEIGIELYHPIQGNFLKVKELIYKKIDQKTADKISRVYRNKKNYLSYSQALKEQIKYLRKDFFCDFFFILTDFSQYYNSNIKYENPLQIDS